MREGRRVKAAAAATAAAIVPLMIQAFSSGPPPARTGAPGEQTCFTVGCHQAAGSEFFQNSQAIELIFPGDPEYQPGVTQRLTLRINDPAGQVFGFQASVRGPSNEQAGVLAPIDATTQIVSQAGIDYIEHTSPRVDGMFQFDWTPPAEDIGAITFYVAANAANNNFAPTGDRIHTRQFNVNPAAAPPDPDRPAIREKGVVHGATFTAAAGFAPNSFGTIFGRNLVERTEVWSDFFVNGQAPTQLGGARVLVNGKPAFLSFTGTAEDFNRDDDQINFVFPADEARGDVTVVVETSRGNTDPFVIQLSDRAPALFPFEPQNRRYVAAILNDGSAFIGPVNLFGGADLGRPIRGARTDELVQVFGTGFGETAPPVPVGQLPDGVVSELVDPVKLFLGETQAEVLFAGLSPFVGVYQFVFRVPALADGDHEIVVEVAGVRTPTGLYLQVDN